MKKNNFNIKKIIFTALFILSIIAIIITINKINKVEEEKSNLAEKVDSQKKDNRKKGNEEDKKKQFSKKDLLDPFSSNSKESSREFLGKVYNDNTFEIFSNTSGKVLYSPKSEGDYIKKGDLIAKVDDKFILNDLGRAKIAKKSSSVSLKKILNISPDEEDFQKIDKNIEKINGNIENIKLNIEKTKKDIEMENNNIDVENINLTIENLESKKTTIKKDIELEINSTVDLLKNLYENDVESYFVENSNNEKVFSYLLGNEKDSEKLDNFRLKLEDKVSLLMDKKRDGQKIYISEINSSVDLFYDYYDFLHYISFDILLLNDNDLFKVSGKTENGKNTLKIKKTVLNKYNQSIIDIENSVKKSKKQIENIGNGKSKKLLSLEIALKNLENSLDQNKKQIEILEIDKRKIKLNYELEDEDIELAELKIKSNNENIKTLEEKLKDTSIYSPVSGKIIIKKVDKNSFINYGSYLMKIEVDEITKIETFVSEEFSQKIKRGQRVLIDKKYKGKISDIENRIDQRNGKVKIEIFLKEKIKNFYIGKIVDVKINFKESNKEKIDIPLSAVFADIYGDNYVYIIDEENEIKKIKIKIDKFENIYVKVKKDFFKDGQKIIKNKTIVE